VDLVLVRHGIALDRALALDRGIADADRPLVRAGIERTVAAMEGLAVVLHRATVAVFSSPWLRARQTADIAAEALAAPPPVLRPALAPGGDPTSVLPEAMAMGLTAVVVVGHEPDLAHALAALLGAPASALRLKKAGAAIVRDPSDGPRLTAFLPPRTLRRLGGATG